jgi:hypothetical protein
MPDQELVGVNRSSVQVLFQSRQDLVKMAFSFNNFCYTENAEAEL